MVKKCSCSQHRTGPPKTKAPRHDVQCTESALSPISKYSFKVQLSRKLMILVSSSKNNWAKDSVFALKVVLFI